MSQDSLPNDERSAFPIKDNKSGATIFSFGLDKLEYTCIHSCIPSTNDDTLNAEIEEGLRIKIATKVLSSIVGAAYESNGVKISKETAAEIAVDYADALLLYLMDIEPLHLVRKAMYKKQFENKT